MGDGKMKSIVRATLWKAVLYGIMIAFAAHVGEAIPFPYHAGIAAWPVSAQTLLFFAGGFALYTACVLPTKIYRKRRESR